MAKKQVALLRGINVAGKNKIKMFELRAALENAGLLNVQTYLQSGNIIFESEVVPKVATKNEANTNANGNGKADVLQTRLAEKIRDCIRCRFDLEVPVLVVSGSDFQRIKDHNPFLTEENSQSEIQPEYLHVTFFEQKPSATKITEMQLPQESGADRFVISSKEVFLYCPGGYGKTKLNNSFFERKLSVQCTTRNWKTVNALCKMLE